MSEAPRQIQATITFLSMEARVGGPPPPRPLLKGLMLLRAENVPVHFYRYLYRTIGKPYYWTERLLMSDEDLAAYLADARTALYILYSGAVPAGMAELDFRDKDPDQVNQAQIAYFGLAPEFIGRGIGPWFLYQTLDFAWDEGVSRIVVNTSSRDHRRALSTYQRAGFVPYGRGEHTIILPPDFPLPPA